jgi:hypothetical protein
MPKEVHYFLFSREETVNALFGYYWLMTPPPRADRGVSASLQKSDMGITATLRVQSTATDKTEFVKFDSDQVLSALVLYCQERRIPLAAREQDPRAVRRTDRANDHPEPRQRPARGIGRQGPLHRRRHRSLAQEPRLTGAAAASRRNPRLRAARRTGIPSAFSGE